MGLGLGRCQIEWSLDDPRFYTLSYNPNNARKTWRENLGTFEVKPEKQSWNQWKGVAEPKTQTENVPWGVCEPLQSPKCSKNWIFHRMHPICMKFTKMSRKLQNCSQNAAKNAAKY